MRFACSLLLALSALVTVARAAGTERFASVKLDVPFIQRPADRSGTTAVAMVLAYYGADSLEWSRVERVFRNKPVSLDGLAGSARSLGYDARVANPGIDSLTTLLRSGVPPILAIDSNYGGRPRTRYVVVTRFDSLGTRFFAQSGSRSSKIEWHVLNAQWAMPGGRALIVTRR